MSNHPLLGARKDDVLSAILYRLEKIEGDFAAHFQATDPPIVPVEETNVRDQENQDSQPGQ